MDMNCQDVQRDLDEFLDGTLDGSTHSATAAHIEDCEGCRQALEETRRLRTALAALP
ncbi:MAG: anti-sigma factor family protein, partial [Pseudomonadota bacterium]